MIAALAAAAGAVVGAGAGGEPAPEAESGFCDALPASDLARVAGQGVIVRMEGRATPELRRQARSGTIGGVVLFPPPEIRGERLEDELESLQRAAERGDNPPLLVAIDQEGGAVERLPALPPQLSPFTMAENDDRRAVVLEGRATGFQLRELGINVNLAPVLDVPEDADHFLVPRAFGTTPEQVARLGLAFASGLRREGVAATAKHFPGLGRAVENTDFAPTTIPGSRAGLAPDIEPFGAAVGRGIDLVMLSSASYPGLGSRSPAALAPEIATGLLRDELGFTGVSITDDLPAPAITSGRTVRQAALEAVAAGVDALLFASAQPSPPGLAEVIARAAAAGRLDPDSVRTSCARITQLKERLASGDPLP